MGSVLTIGSIADKEEFEAAINHLISLRLLKKEPSGKILGSFIEWISAPEEVDYLDILNLSSVIMFLEHVATLEGISDVNQAVSDSKFKHLPWWMSSIWLPVPFEEPKVPESEHHGFPFFLGSSYGLLKDLEDIRQLSDVNLGDTPPGYEKMRRDIRAFYLSNFVLEEDDHILQWVWKALFDGATISINEKAPMQGVE